MVSGKMKEKFFLLISKVWKDIVTIKWALVAIGAYFLVTQVIFDEFCLMRILTGFPCPGCGATRACMRVLGFKWKEALDMNPTIFLWIPYILFLIYQRYIGKKQPKLSNILLVVVCVITILWYLTGMALYFPNREPFTFFDGNLLQKCYPLLYEMLKFE